MDLNLSPDEIKFRDELRAWLAANAPTDWDERREESMESRFEYLKRWQRKLYEGGWAGISWPKEYGGRGASLMEQVIFWQEMALAQAPPHGECSGVRALLVPRLSLLALKRRRSAIWQKS